MPQLKAILFDLDNTLIDWRGFNGDYRQLEMPRIGRIRDYVIECGYSLPETLALVEAFGSMAEDAWHHGRQTLVAPSFFSILETLLTMYEVPLSALDRDILIERYDWGAIPGAVVFPEVPHTLQTLRDAGLHLVIVTNAFQPMVMRDRELANLGLLQYFDGFCRLTAADVGYLKPHPFIFERALACSGATAEEAVFVGDSLGADIAGATSYGIKAVWRDVGTHESESLRGKVLPNATIRTLDQLFPLLDQWFPNWRP
ncbi:MAG: HAD family hydrolase [Phototrophicaceae bacterium]|jgi:HAD superfamily hydrolase (TIGR01509 family)